MQRKATPAAVFLYSRAIPTEKLSNIARAIPKCLLLAFALLFSVASASAQVATGSYPYATVDSHGFDSINVGSLNVHFAIPVFQKAGRGIPFYYGLAYDSSVWQLVNHTAWQPVQNYGWTGQTVVTTGYISYTTVNIQCDLPLPQHGTYYTYSNFV